MGGMGFFFQSKELPRPASLTFTLKEAGHTYDDGHVGLAPTMLTISEQRVAVIGLNGAGKSTLLGLMALLKPISARLWCPAAANN